MRNSLNLALLILLIFTSCTQAKKTETVIEPQKEELTFPDKLASSTIYEINIRQFTPEGTFNAFATHLPRLKELGVDVLWLMPIHPISELNRKGTLGSYYAPKDYKGVNPEFGTVEDLKTLVNKAHEMGFYLILDWVPNHTGRDHAWVTEHPDYYIRDAAGNVTYESMSPTDVWWDTALLDNYNLDTRKAMIDAMKYWVEKVDIDGFRLDHGCGDKIPLYLWEEARAVLDPIKDLFWLAECDEETFILDGSYAGQLEGLMIEIVKGNKNADDLEEWIKDDMFEFGRTAYRMTFTTNHDKNSWNGTVFERFNEGHKTFAAMIFTAYGIPMIYNGQEAGLDKRLEFFEKDQIDWSDPKGLISFYQKLVALKKNNVALWAGDDGGFAVRINENPNVYAIKREMNDNQVIGLFNLSKEIQPLKLTDVSVVGTYKDYFTETEYELSTITELNLEPWQFLVFVK
ncbi:MAG: glycosidase [Cyclobacteriaceae bacterium]|jgi:glycosidase